MRLLADYLSGRPVEVAQGIYQLRAVGVKVTAVSTSDDELVLIDAGAKGSLPLIAAGLRTLHLDVASVGLIAVTHYHPDHAGDLASLRRAAGAKVAAHTQEVGVIEGSQPKPSPFVHGGLATVMRPFMRFFYGEPAGVDYPVNDGDLLPYGTLEIRVIHVPGHTPGSICLYVPRFGILIVGDAMEFREGELGPPAPSVTWDLVLARRSLEKLLELDFEIICFSHFPPLIDGAKQALEELVLSFDRT